MCAQGSAKVRLLLPAFLLYICFGSNALAQLPKVDLPKPPPVEYEEPPEEDEGFKDTEYFFNPLQAKKEMDAGNFYFRKGNYSAAEYRYAEATKWDSFNAEGFKKLGETEEKLKQYAKARDAWTQFIELTDNESEKKDAQDKIDEWDKKGLLSDKVQKKATGEDFLKDFLKNQGPR